MADSKVKAQVTIEFTIALICLVLLLAGTANMFAWFANTIIGRHRAYEASRTSAGTGSIIQAPLFQHLLTNFYRPEKLVIFKKWE